jgi:hypothetical protein
VHLHSTHMPTDLERSHDELRAAVILGGRQIRKWPYAKGSESVLNLLRKALRDARQVRWRENSTAR